MKVKVELSEREIKEAIGNYVEKHHKVSGMEVVLVSLEYEPPVAQNGGCFPPIDRFTATASFGRGAASPKD